MIFDFRFAVFNLLLLGASASAAEVIVYTSVDEPVARNVMKAFEKRTGHKVIIQTDTEATKSVGLAERLEAERSNPQCDVWWGNEPFHTINLAGRGVLAPYESPAAKDIPARFKDAGHLWASSGLRVRVIARTTARPVRAIASITDLTDPALKNKIAMGPPRIGTISGQVSALYTIWGNDKADQFFRDLKANGVRIVGGNSVVAEMVGQGVLWAGLTDNDDVQAMIREKGKIEMVIPDQGDGQIGTLPIPTTVALVAGAKRPDPARQLIDYLLSPDVEKSLIEADFARYSVRTLEKSGLRAMDVDYTKVAANMKEAITRAHGILD